MCRWHAASPAHPPAVPVHQRVDAKAFLHRRRPSQPPRFPEPFLPQKREDRIVCPAFHARREQPEVPNVVTIAVGNVIGERGQELGRCVAGLDGAFRGMSRALLKLSGGSVHDYATISADSPSPSRASRARRAATSAGIS